ncbi:SGNH hydrolase-type esterase domain-containing protein [Dactylonectria estremocensis]|uniref:SGNH hydrolase-type esterase domain-containing protein n=1 Tax=Dactylonectria estremocensis TaxID=1079267 RepID=A0A9P9D324_9HYPO|nr:SGNH hydrolase-type esterase domain-containing protein [Dactylonectria estremocensis]
MLPVHFQDALSLGIPGDMRQHTQKEKTKVRKSGQSELRKVKELGQKAKILTALFFFDPIAGDFSVGGHIHDGETIPDFNLLFQNHLQAFNAKSTVDSISGWGNGFLENLKETNDGSNYAINGASTETFLAEERWDRVMEDVEKETTEYKSVFWENLRRMAEEVLAVDGTPMIITPLTRREFRGGKIIECFKEYRLNAIRAAHDVVTYLDLNQESTKYINAIGQINAAKYNPELKDWTHLNKGGGIVFGRMVVDLLLRKLRGVFASGDEDFGVESNTNPTVQD